jgi:hypothetical protein
MLKLPALATWHLLCHLTLGWPLYKSESVLSRKTYLGQPGRVNHWPRAVGHCRQVLGVNNGGCQQLLRQTDVKCRRPRDKWSSSVRCSH